MRSGLLRKEWNIQRFEELQDTSGAVVKQWRTIATRRMDVRPFRGRETVQAGQEVAEVTHKCWLRIDRRIRDLRAKDRLTRNDRIMDIEQVWNSRERDRYFELMLREVT